MAEVKLEDINKYITMIRINFENSYQAQTKEERQILYSSWYEILKSYPKEVCDRAVINALKHAKFAPRIGDIVEQIEKLREAYEVSETELWAEMTGVLREVEYCAYCFRFTAIQPNGKTQGDNARDRVKEIFNNLSPELQEYLRDTRGLINMAGSGEKELAFEKGRFMKQIPTIRERARTRQETSDSLAGVLKELTVHFSIDSPKNKLLEG